MMTKKISKLINFFFKNIYNLDLPVNIRNYNQLKILDVGSGFNPRLIADVLVNNTAIYDGKKSVIEKDRYYTANIENLPFKDKYFDIVITNHVLEHVRNPDIAFRELNRVAKKVLIITPSSLRECKGTDDDHYWFVYGQENKLVFEAIPTNFAYNKDSRKQYYEKFTKLGNSFAIGEETVYFEDSIEMTDDILVLSGVIDRERFTNNYSRFRTEEKSHQATKKPFKIRAKVFLKTCLRKLILLIRKKLDSTEYLVENSLVLHKPTETKQSVHTKMLG